jgi:hypothetical protein
VINHSTIVILSKFKRDTCVWFGSVLFVHLMVMFSSCILWLYLLSSVSFGRKSVYVDECGSQVQSYMFLVKYFCRINIGIDDYLVEDLCVR